MECIATPHNARGTTRARPSIASNPGRSSQGSGPGNLSTACACANIPPGLTTFMVSKTMTSQRTEVD